ncbi:hypothetical protein E4U30_000547, partial [Claviceps sp. LM220 group G6]
TSHPLSGPGKIQTLECPVMMWFIVRSTGRKFKAYLLRNLIHVLPEPMSQEKQYMPYSPTKKENGNGTQHQ